MRTLAILFLVHFIKSLPIIDDNIVIDKDFLFDELIEYTSNYDIVNIHVPLYGVNYTDKTNSILVFFVQANLSTGQIDYKGVHSLKHGQATQVLDKGRDIASTKDENAVYFGASDGIYKYFAPGNTADKFGSITDSIINIEKFKGRTDFYILTEDKQLYEITDRGKKKRKIKTISNATDILMDNSNNLYFQKDKKVLYVMMDNDRSIKKIEGLPLYPKEVRLLRPPSDLFDSGIMFMSDNKIYKVSPDSPAIFTNLEIDIKMSAIAMEGTLIQFFGYNKQIYEYNFLILYLSGVVEAAKEFAPLKNNKEFANFDFGRFNLM